MFFVDSDFPENPYPGARPDRSFAHEAGLGWPMAPAGPGWNVDGRTADEWLAERDAAPLAGRVPVLAYGSNANPSKITWLRSAYGLSGPVVVLRVRCTGLAAVWATHLRIRDGQRPATLMAEPGRVEWHAVWLATPDQVRVLDQCEGRGVRYRLVRLDCGTVTTEGGTDLTGVLAYTAAGEQRAPLLVDGRAVRCADVPQAAALRLSGTPGPDGLTVREITGSPG
ncbi:MAG TPA: gamma-glutamylcyclotransferase [Pseudonocardiaceae bacterium]|nr:gamma-glutamylcyclotransferase [Pseudonocardiaceae bacterium]